MTRNAIHRWNRPEVIVVATNFLEGPSLMLNAIDQAKLTGAKILLVHVIECYQKALPQSEPHRSVPNSELRTVTAQMRQMSAEFQQQGIQCESVILKGLPAEQIAELVRSRSAERVIVTTGKFGGNERLYTIPVAEKLASVLYVPVCIVGRNVHGSPACTTAPVRILVAVSFHPASAHCVRFACDLAKQQEMRLTLLHVVETTGLNDVEKKAARTEALQKLSTYLPDQHTPQYKPILSIREGDAATEILAEAQATNQNYLVLGAPTIRTISGFMAGDVVHSVLAEANCPVFTLKPETATIEEELEDASTSGCSATLLSPDNVAKESTQTYSLNEQAAKIPGSNPACSDTATSAANGVMPSDSSGIFLRPRTRYVRRPYIHGWTRENADVVPPSFEQIRDGNYFESQMPIAHIKRTDLLCQLRLLF